MTARNGGSGGFSLIEEHTTPDYYANSTNFEVSVYGITIEFGQTRPPGPGGGKVPHIPRVRVHMSPQHAKVIAKLLAKNVKEYEKQVGKIDLPTPLLEELHLTEDWD